MTIDRADFDAVTEDDLQELVEAQVPEGLRLEYKSAPYGRTDRDKRELLKDISALANSHGGHLVIGIEEVQGVATNIVGVSNIDIDKEILRIENVARSGLEPPVPGMRIRPIPLASGANALLIRIQPSWTPPHRVSSGGHNRFYMRHSAGVHEPSIEELRTLFNQSEAALNRARKFRNERISIVKKGSGQRPLEAGGRLFIHIVPVAAFSGMIQLDIKEAYENRNSFRPLGSSGMTPKYNYYGFINERGGTNNFGYTQIFRNGALEAVKANIGREADGVLNISGKALERDVFERLSQYVSGLRELDIPPPLIVMFTLEGVEGAIYRVGTSYEDAHPPQLPEDIVALPECILEDYGEELDHHRAVRPAFDALWNAMGFGYPLSFDEEGRWVGTPAR